MNLGLLATTRARLIAFYVVAVLTGSGLVTVYTMAFGIEVAAEQVAFAFRVTADGADRYARAHGGALSPDYLRAGVRFENVAPAQQIVYRAWPEAVRRHLVALADDPADVRVEASRGFAVWLRRPSNPAQWVVIDYPNVGLSGVALAVLALCIAAVGAVAGLYAARAISRPIEQLARALPNWNREVGLPVQARAPAEITELARTLNDALERAAAAASEREQLLAGVSHDLRTPLTRLLLAFDLEDDRNEIGRTAMLADLKEMGAIIDSFLDFVREGRYETLVPMDLIALVRGALERVTDPDQWQCQWPTESVVLRLRGLSVKRALVNLIQNAERHGKPPYRIEFNLSAEWVEVAVIDAGGGPPAELLPVLGKPFLHGSGAGAGSGLGLSVVRRVVDAHGGEFRAERRADGFSVRMRFRRLPLP